MAKDLMKTVKDLKKMVKDLKKTVKDLKIIAKDLKKVKVKAKDHQDHQIEEDSNQPMMAVKDLQQDLEKIHQHNLIVDILMAQKVDITKARLWKVVDILMAQIMDIQNTGSPKTLTTQTLRIALMKIGVIQHQTAQNSTMLILRELNGGKVEFSHNKKF